MSAINVILLLLASSLMSIEAIGRNPQPVDHNLCRIRYNDVLTQVKSVYRDQGARIVAYNKGLEGDPCLTSCRVLFRGNQKDLADIQSPDAVICAPGANPRYCLNGRCVLPPSLQEQEGVKYEFKKNN